MRRYCLIVGMVTSVLGGIFTLSVAFKFLGEGDLWNFLVTVLVFFPLCVAQLVVFDHVLGQLPRQARVNRGSGDVAGISGDTAGTPWAQDPGHVLGRRDPET